MVRLRTLAALFSGGKDSTHAVHLAQQSGFEVRRLITARPARSDSHMFHTPNLHVTEQASESMGIPLTQVPVSGEKDREVEELEAGLRPITHEVDGLLVGAIASDYQWARANEVAQRLGLGLYAPLWRVDPVQVLRDEVASGLKFMMVAAQSEGLTPEWLGHAFDDAYVERLLAQAALHRFNPAGEGGEYETLATDGPLFTKRIRVDAYHVVVGKDSSYFVVDECSLTSERGPV